MSVFTDPQEKKPVNKERREEKIKALMDALLDPEKNLQVASLANVLHLEKMGGFIVAFTMNDIEEGDYDRCLIKGDYGDQGRRIWLFCAERDCTREFRDRTKDCAIPVMELSPEFVVECTVIDTDTLQPDVKELIEKNFVICQNVLAD